MNKIKGTLLIASALIVLSACGSTSIEPKGIEIFLGTDVVKKIDAKIGDTFQLIANISPSEANQAVTWSIDNTNVATISEEGKLTTTAEGEAIITARSSSNSKVSTNLYLFVTPEEEQVGLKKVGTGFSKNDPIFGGNEGKDAPLEIYFIEMRQMYADSIYIKKGHFDMLIDSGEAFDGKYISQFLKDKMEDDNLDVLMASHGDSDHIAGMKNALKDIPTVSTCIDYGGLQNSAYNDVKQEYIKKGTAYHTAYDSVNQTNGATDVYYLTDEVTLEILNTGNYSKNNEKKGSNPNSVACLLTYKDFRFFTAGDLTSSSEQDLLKNEKDLPNVTLYKASHHGSSGSNSQSLLNKLNPKGVAVSAARSTSSYGIEPSETPTERDTNLDLTGGHPHKEAMERIYKTPRIMETLDVHWNAVNGTMCYSTTGEDGYKFTGSTPKKGYYDLSKTGGKGEWDSSIKDFKNKVTGEENKKLHETVVFKAREWTDLVEGLL